MPQVSDKVKQFCKKLDKALREGYWGDIDPYVFRLLADGDVEEDEDDDDELGTDAMNKLLEDIL